MTATLDRPVDPQVVEKPIKPLPSTLAGKVPTLEPSASAHLTEEQIDQLVAYLKTLK